MEKTRLSRNTISQLNKITRTENLIIYLFIPVTAAVLSFGFIFAKNLSPVLTEVKGMKAEMPECAPFNINVERVNSNSADIGWETVKDDCYSIIQYGNESDNLNLMSVSVSDENSESQYRSTLKNLEPNKKYYFIIISGEGEYGINGEPVSFKTKSLETF